MFEICHSQFGLVYLSYLLIEDSDRVHITPSHRLSQAVPAAGQSRKYTKHPLFFLNFNHGAMCRALLFHVMKREVIKCLPSDFRR